MTRQLPRQQGDKSEHGIKNMETTKIIASELCSRKLWQLVNAKTEEQVSDTELNEAIQELAKRRHYLEELQELGKLETMSGH